MCWSMLSCVLHQAWAFLQTMDDDGDNSLSEKVLCSPLACATFWHVHLTVIADQEWLCFWQHIGGEEMNSMIQNLRDAMR